jgi:nucleoside-diphosphate-sugar epimerase
MRVLITGAAGFLGKALTTALLARGALCDAQGVSRPITELLLADRAPVIVSNVGPIGVQALAGDLADATFVDALAQRRCDAIFHLAASLTLDAEQDAAAAYAVNVDAIRRLIEAGAAQAKLVFVSSIAVFGGVLPDVVDDTLRAAPATTYGTHKAIVELLLADYSRRGQVDARSLRLPIVLVRDGAPSPTVSDRVAAIVREPLAGRDVDCGLRPDTAIPVASSQAVAAALIALHDVPADDLPHGRALNLPALTVRVADMARAVERHGRHVPVGRIRFVPDPALQRIVDGWPSGFVSAHASRLGLQADASFDDLLTAYLAQRA